MQRLLINGSPRGKASNSSLILSWISEGLQESGADPAPLIHLARTGEAEAHRQAFLEVEEVLLVFPLYTDSMPALVKSFFESLSDAAPEHLQGKRIAFVIQSGFPEAVHCEALAAYLPRLCSRLGLVHAGTITMGGAEGIRLRPPKQLRKIRARFVTAGRELAAGGFSQSLAARIAGKRTFGPLMLAIFRLVSLTGVQNFYWNMMLKKHGAWEKRFDAPFGPSLKG
jgi:NAD(P)H-dependent FMN reductase